MLEWMQAMCICELNANPCEVAGMKIPGCRKVSHQASGLLLCMQALGELLRHKLVGYDSTKGIRLRFSQASSRVSDARLVKDGYRLTYPGYDHLALHVFANRDVICRFVREANVY